MRSLASVLPLLRQHHHHFLSTAVTASPLLLCYYHYPFALVVVVTSVCHTALLAFLCWALVPLWSIFDGAQLVRLISTFTARSVHGQAQSCRSISRRLELVFEKKHTSPGFNALTRAPLITSSLP